MGAFFTRHTCLFFSFVLPGKSHAVLAVFFDNGIPPHGVVLTGPGLGAIFMLFIEWKRGLPRIPQSPAGIAPARLCF
jgi:hypothetical protein